MQLKIKGNIPITSSPAIRAFNSVGIYSVSDFKRYTIKDISKLHGVGPKVIKLLKEAGVTFKTESK